MPTARPLAPTPLRRAAFIAAAVAASLVVTSFVNTGTTRACVIVMPTPLRELYVMSDLVVLGSFGETTAVKMLGFEENMPYERYLMRTELKVSSTVKGAGNYSTLHVYHLGWKAKDNTGHTLDQYKGDDKLLIFLKRREGVDGYEQTDDSYGIKKLTDAALKVYVQRLDELGLIMQQEKPDPASADDEEETEEAAVAVTETEDGKKDEEEEQPVYGSKAEQRTTRLERFIARAEIVLAR